MNYDIFKFLEVHLRRDEDSDEEGWREKEASRTTSVKFTDNLDLDKEDFNKEV